MGKLGHSEMKSLEYHCRICGCPLEAHKAVSCSKCSVPFHKECWHYNDGCGIYGCGSKKWGAFTPSNESELLSITENSRPPFSPWPIVERVARSLPRWGRVHGTAALLGCAGPIMTFFGIVLLTAIFRGTNFALEMATLFLYSAIFDPYVWILAAVGPISGVASSMISPHERRWGALIGVIGFGLATYFITAGHSLLVSIFGLTNGGSMAGVAFLFSSLVASSATAGWLVSQEKTKTRAFTTVALLGSFFILLRLLEGSRALRFEELVTILAFSLLGFAVAAPQLVFSKSALFHRLKAED